MRTTKGLFVLAAAAAVIAIMASCNNSASPEYGGPCTQHVWGDWASGSGADFDRWVQVQKNEAANGYRLPTSAQWEYAARAGTTTHFNDGVTNGWTTQEELDAIDLLAWTNNNSGGVQEVGQLRPNAWGLYDMHGNLWEWCWGVSGGGGGRVLRGGAWSRTADVARSSFWGYGDPWLRFNSGGFRLVRHAN